VDGFIIASIALCIASYADVLGDRSQVYHLGM